MNKKIVIFSVAMVLLLGITMGATFALLTDESAVVTNTFTYGYVKITLDETDVDKMGVPVWTDSTGDNIVTEGTAGATIKRVTANEYKLIPGQEYTKDPTVHIDPAAEDSWLFVKVENGIADYEIANGNNAEGSRTIEEQMLANDWLRTDIDNVWKFKDKVSADEDIPVFEYFIIDENAQVQNMHDQTVKVEITAYAVQADGLDTLDAGWSAAKNLWFTTSTD